MAPSLSNYERTRWKLRSVSASPPHSIKLAIVPKGRPGRWAGGAWVLSPPKTRAQATVRRRPDSGLHPSSWWVEGPALISQLSFLSGSQSSFCKGRSRGITGPSPGTHPGGRCAEPRPHQGCRSEGARRPEGSGGWAAAPRMRTRTPRRPRPGTPDFLSGSSREASARLAAPPAGRTQRESARSAPSPRPGRAGRRLGAVPGLDPRSSRLP